MKNELFDSTPSTEAKTSDGRGRPWMPGSGERPVRPSAAPRVMIAEDDEAIRKILLRVFAAFHYEVGSAADGNGAWRGLQERSFDLLVTDYEMPRMNGIELMRLVRVSTPLLPVILISANIPWNERDIDSLLSPGVAVEKPFTVPVFMSHVRRLLHQEETD